MNRKRSALLLGAALTASLAAQEPPADPGGAVRALTRETRARYFEWTAERQGENPLVAALPKFRELADAGRGTDAGADALLAIVYFGGMEAGFRREVGAAIDDLLQRHLQSPRLARLPRRLPAVLPEVLAKDERLAVLQKLVDGSKVPEVRQAAMFWAGRCSAMGHRPGHVPPADRDQALAWYARLRKEYPDSDLLAEVEAIEFELQNLQVGARAPDFDATDVEGQEFKLSDYRGKVTVLYFWGFW